MKYPLVNLAYLFILIISFQSQAVAQPPSQLKEAHSAFKKKDYVQALTLYQQSFEQQPNEQTQYNIAVCHFKLAQWQQAYDLFEQLETEQGSINLYTYNKALSLKKLERIEEAINAFEDVELFSDDETLELLAMKQLSLLEQGSNQYAEATSASSESGEGEWFGSVSLNLGHDDNVTLPDDEFITGTSDTFIESMASISYLTDNQSKNPWTINSTFYNTQYDQATDFDVRFLSIGTAKSIRLGDTNTHKMNISIDYDDLNLSGDDYLSTFRFKARYFYTVNNDAKIQASWQYKKTSDDNELFYFLAGDSHTYTLKWQQLSGSNYWSLAGKYNFDNKEDLSSDTRYISFSAHRTGIYYSYYWMLDPINIAFSTNYRYSLYTNSNWDLDEESNEVTVYPTREDQRFSLSLDADYEFSKGWLATVHGEYTDNNSNIEHYDYQQSLFTIGLSYQF